MILDIICDPGDDGQPEAPCWNCGCDVCDVCDGSPLTDEEIEEQ